MQNPLVSRDRLLQESAVNATVRIVDQPVVQINPVLQLTRADNIEMGGQNLGLKGRAGPDHPKNEYRNVGCRRKLIANLLQRLSAKDLFAQPNVRRVLVAVEPALL